MPDSIRISQLKIAARLGVTEEERAHPQKVTVDLVCFPRARGFANVDDRIEKTVDYAAMCECVAAIAGSQPRNLIETLAEHIASALLDGFPLEAVEVEIRKYVIPNADYAAVRIRRPGQEHFGQD